MPRKIYRAIQTPISFRDSGGSYVLTLQNLASGAGRISAQVDRGATNQPVRYKWKAVIQWAATPTATDYVDVLLGESAGILGQDANVGTADAAITSDDAANLKRLGIVKSQAAASAVNNITSGTVMILDRYFQVGIFNRSTTALLNTANTSLLIFTPIPDEIQI